MPNIIACNFDNTLFHTEWPDIKEPNWSVINWCKERQQQGDILILWTCRHGKTLKAALKACKQVGLIFDYVNNHAKENLEKFGPADRGRKIYATVYIDDKAFRPNELDTAEKYLEEHQHHGNHS